MRLIDADALKKDLHNFFYGKVIDEPAYILRGVFCHIESATTVPVLDICEDCNSKSYDIGFNAGYEAGKTDALRKWENADEKKGGAE